MKLDALALSVILSLVSLSAIQRPALGSDAGDASTKDQPSPINHTIPSIIKDKLKPSEVRTFGESPRVRWQVIKESNPRTFLIVLGTNDDVISSLNKFAQANRIKGASFSGIGAVGCAALGYFDQDKMSYKVIKVQKQAELVSFSGNISTMDNRYVVHAHGVVALEDGSCLGGHVLYTSTWPTTEIMLTETDVEVNRHTEADSGMSFLGQAGKEKSK